MGRYCIPSDHRRPRIGVRPAIPGRSHSTPIPAGRIPTSCQLPAANPSSLLANHPVAVRIPHVGRAQVGVVDDAQAAWGAELGFNGFAGKGVGDLFTSPPAFVLEDGREAALELVQGGSVFERGIDCYVEIGKDVEACGLGGGEKDGVLLLPEIAPVEGDLVALGFEETDCFCGGQAGIDYGRQRASRRAATSAAKPARESISVNVLTSRESMKRLRRARKSARSSA